MTPEPNDRTPLDFTRALELADGTEVHLGKPWGDNLYWYAVGGEKAGFINQYGRRPKDPTGPQIVRNRVEEVNPHGTGRSAWPYADAAEKYSSTPAAPEPDGEVVGMGRFWLTVQNPGEVPRRKGPFLVTKTASVLREFMQAHPAAYINVLTVDPDGTPEVEHGPQTLQMLDGRSMSVGRRHNQRVRDAEAALTPPSPQPMSDERVERVAKTIHRARFPTTYTAHDDFWQQLSDDGREKWFGVARAAIAAMDTPPQDEVVGLLREARAFVNPHYFPGTAAALLDRINTALARAEQGEGA